MHWPRFLLIAAGVFGATGVVAGAFASHGLGSLVEPFSNGLTGFVQNWLGGSNTKNS
jgi:hypothetical protein